VGLQEQEIAATQPPQQYPMPGTRNQTTCSVKRRASLAPPSRC